MKTPASTKTFSLRSEFRAAVLGALDACSREIVVLDPTFETWPLETADGEAALRAAILRGATLRVLVGDAAWLERHGTRLLRLQREFPERIQCRELAPEMRSDESLLGGDRLHLLRRAHASAFRGRVTVGDASLAEPALRRCESMWEASTPCLAPTTLGL